MTVDKKFELKKMKNEKKNRIVWDLFNRFP